MSIFTNNSNVFETKTVEEKCLFYTSLGKHDFLENNIPMKNQEDESVYAKKIIRSNGTIKYLIRLDYSAKFFNPFSIYDKEDQRQSVEFLNSVCRNNKKFKEVSGKVFSFYIEFLSSKNMSCFYNAERESQ
jgi:hypothetical protein